MFSTFNEHLESSIDFALTRIKDQKTKALREFHLYS